jgi:hypothetical protein
MDREEGRGLAETNRMTSDAAVNREEREIARAMDDEQQREDVEMERPHERRIERMIEDAERKQEQTREPAFRSPDAREAASEGSAADGAERGQDEAARATEEAEHHSPPH